MPLFRQVITKLSATYEQREAELCRLRGSRP
jgi:hypothetical protein